MMDSSDVEQPVDVPASIAEEKTAENDDALLKLSNLRQQSLDAFFSRRTVAQQSLWIPQNLAFSTIAEILAS